VKLNNKLLYVLIGILLILVACSSATTKIEVEYNKLTSADSILLYEHIDTSSGATGACAGTFVDRWYGSKLPYEDLIEIYENQLPDKGWVLWPEDVVRIWRKRNASGLFGFYMQAFNGDKINPRGLYELPDTFMLEAADHSTVYVISMTYMDNFHTRRCFGK
jgi:hypothetical protein